MILSVEDLITLFNVRSSNFQFIEFIEFIGFIAFKAFVEFIEFIAITEVYSIVILSKDVMQ